MGVIIAHKLNSDFKMFEICALKIGFELGPDFSEGGGIYNEIDGILDDLLFVQWFNYLS